MKRILVLLISQFWLVALVFSQNQHLTFRSKTTYPGESVANVWGYVADGREYALIGAAKGLIITDVTDPDHPNQIVQIPGPNNLWKEIKTFGHYAYVTSEGGLGLQIVDLSKLPNADLDYHYYTGDGIVTGSVYRIHALHIDEKKGFVYLYGARKPDNSYLFGGGAVVLNLNQDPYNPVYAGKFDQLGYIHDGYADNDTLYGGHIYQGIFSIVDMSNKSAPKLLASQNTPNLFTHTNDHRTLLTTDEKSNSFLTSFDISNPDNIRQLDKIQSNPGTGSAVHNTHIVGNYAVTSWYKDGFTIVDVSRPDNLVQVGNYDTYPNGGGSGFEGCWGVYPFFPSGNIIASTITAAGTNDGELWILTPEYVRACYLEGKISDGLNGNPLNGVLVDVVGSNQTNTVSDGSFKTGQEKEGYFIVKVSKSGYQPREFTVYFQRGELRVLNISLYQDNSFSVSGQVLNGQNNQPVAGASVVFSGTGTSMETTTDQSGNFAIPSLPAGLYDISAGAAGFGQVMLYHRKIFENKTYTIHLLPGGKLFHGENPDMAAGISPNPFRNQTTIRYESPNLEVTVFDLTGRQLRTIKPLGQSGRFDFGAELRPGIYLARVSQAGQIVKTIKLIKTD